MLVSFYFCVYALKIPLAAMFSKKWKNFIKESYLLLVDPIGSFHGEWILVESMYAEKKFSGVFWSWVKY